MKAKASFCIALLLALALAWQVIGAEAYTRSVVYKVTSIYEVKNDGPGGATEVVVTLPIIKDWSGWASQKVLSTEISPPAEENVMTEDNQFVRISFPSIPAGERREIRIIQILKVDHVQNLVPSPNFIGSSVSPDFGYTSAIEGLWESDDSKIKANALELTKDQPNLYFKARRIFDFVKEYLQYQAQPVEHSALWAFQNKIGDCTEFTNLFIALCRAAGIPSKFVDAYGYNPELADNLPAMGHAFALIYLPGATGGGWIPVDLIWPLHVGQFAEIDYDHIVLATSDGANMVKDGMIRPPAIYNWTWKEITGAPANVSVKMVSGSIEKEVGIGVELNASPRVYGGDLFLDLTVIIRNEGLRQISNVRVEVPLDPSYFELAGMENEIGTLMSGQRQVFEMSIRAKPEASGKAFNLTARASYQSSMGGFNFLFMDEDTRRVEMPILKSPSTPTATPSPTTEEQSKTAPESLNLNLAVILTCFVFILVVVFVFLKKR